MIARTLDLPYYRRSGEAYRIVHAIVKTLKDALLRGEEVQVDGFGILRIYERPAQKKRITHYLYFKQAHPAQDVIQLAPKKRVIFKPSRALHRFLNEDLNA